jgi:hypothetical protein
MLCIEISCANVVRTAVHGGARLCYTVLLTRKEEAGRQVRNQSGFALSQCAVGYTMQSPVSR